MIFPRRFTIYLICTALFTVLSPLFASPNDGQLNILVIGSTHSYSEGGESGVDHEKAFNPAAIGTRLSSILSQDSAISDSVNVVFEDLYKSKTLDTAVGGGGSLSSFDYYCYSLMQHFMWPEGKDARLANLRGANGTSWDYIILCEDPYVMANFPGVYAEGVKMIQGEVAQGGAQLVLLAQWPEVNNASSYSAMDFNEIVYRVGNSAGLAVVPAGKAWNDYGSKDSSSSHPTPRGQYLAASAIYGTLFSRNANSSNYSYSSGGNAIANHVWSVVQAVDPDTQYTGRFDEPNAFQMNFINKRKIDYTDYGTSTEAGFRNGLNDAFVASLVSWERRNPPASGNPVDFNYSRGSDIFEANKQYQVNAAKHDHAYGFPMGDHRNTGAVTMKYGIDKRYIGSSFYNGTDLGIAYSAVLQNEISQNVKALPVRLLWSKVSHFQPGINSHRDSWHLSNELDRAVGGFMFTMTTGRCPVDAEPADINSNDWKFWYCRKLGYETAWQMAHLTTRAPGFRVTPSSASALSITPTNTETMKVQFVNPPQSEVTVNVAVSNTNAAIVGPQKLVFTPQNYNVPQDVVLAGLPGSSSSQDFDVVFNTTSNDEVYHELSDSWKYTINRSSTQTFSVVDKGTTTLSAFIDTPKLISLNTSGAASGNTEFSGPNNGSLAWLGADVVYTPSAGFTGKDGFAFAVNENGTLSIGYIEIDVLDAVAVGTISYNGNGNNGGSVPFDGNSYSENDLVTVLGNTGALVKTGHSFSGWNTDSDGSGSSYASGGNLTMGAQGVVLFAQWTPDTYTITYHANNATSGGAPSNQVKTFGVDLTLTGNTGNLSRTGDNFIGWNTTANGSGQSFSTGATFSLEQNTTLYAEWNAPPVVDAGPNQLTSLSGSTLWTPADISTAAWYDASDTTTITDSGGAVSQWNDKSGNDNHATQSNSNVRPTTGSRTIGGKNIIVFPNTNNESLVMPTVDVIGKEVWAIFVIDDYTTAGAQLILGGSGNRQIGVNSSSGKTRLWSASNPYFGDSHSNAVIASASPAVVGWLAHTSTKKFSVNGTLELTGDNYNSGTLSPTNIGRGQYGAMDGAIGEIIITSGELTTEDRQRMEGYLAHKWGVESNLPANHPHKTAAPGGPRVIVNLDGTVSDPENDLITTAWSVSSGPSSVAFENVAAADTTATLTIEGTYVLELTASDSNGSASDQMTITVGDVGDTTPPTLASADIVDDRGGVDVMPGDLVTYTVTFSEDMDASSVTASDFSNAGSSSINIGSIAETSAGVFSVQVTPNSGGTLRLQVASGASINDVAGNALLTSSAIIDDTLITVIAIAIVPDVLGLAQATAEANIVTANLVVGAVTSQNDATVPTGDVISQSPAGSTSIAGGSSVDLVISLGPEAAGGVVFSDDFEAGTNPFGGTTQDVSTYNVTNTSKQANSALWVRASAGFGSDRNGLIDESENGGANFTDPTGEQAYGFRYTNSGLTTAEGLIGSLTSGTTINVSFDVVIDDFNGGATYDALLLAFDTGADRNAVESGNKDTAAVLAQATGNVAADGNYYTVNFSYTVGDDVVDNDGEGAGSNVTFLPALLGKDIALRIDGAADSANIDNVEVSISGDAPAMATVPDVLGLAQATAEANIVAANLVVGVVTSQNDATVPLGDVISQNPAGSTSIAEGSDVDLVVSIGPAMATVPDVLGLAQATAEANIVAANLVVGAVTSQNDATVPTGDVISQSPAGSTSIAGGSSVDLVISLGPEAAGGVVFSDDFEAGTNPFGGTTQDVSTYNVTNTSKQANSALWVRASAGFGSNRNGLIDESENGGANFTDPTGEQAYGFRYTNSGLTTAEGLIGSLTSGTTINVSFDVVIDDFNGGATYDALLLAFDTGADRNAVESGNKDTAAVLAQATGNVAADGNYYTVNFSYTVGDDVVDNDGEGAGSNVTFLPALLGKDIALRIDGAADSANIDNVEVSISGDAPAMATVPDVLGLAQATAEANIVAANLVVGAVTSQNDATVPTGDVISQSPAGSTSIAGGSSVDLVISLGPEAAGGVVFSDDFEAGTNSFGGTTQDVSTYNVTNTSKQANSALWVRASAGFGSDRNGLIDESENGGANFTDPTGEQAYGFRYTNSGLTTAEGLIGSLTSGTTINVSFDVVIDDFNGGAIYDALLLAFDTGADRNAVESGNKDTAAVLAQATGNVAADGNYYTVNFSYTVGDDVVDNDGEGAGSNVTFLPALLGKDIALRIDGAADSANIDNVEVSISGDAPAMATVPTGDVISQSPAGSTSIAEGSDVDLVISLGVETVTVPDILGLTRASAESSITANQLAVGTISSEYSSTVSVGDVISQGLNPGAVVPIASTVNLVISLGIDPSPKLVHTTVSSVSNTSWVTVDLGQTYNSPVIIATPIYADNAAPPVVTRITNVTSTGFDLKLDRVDGLTAPVSIEVSIVAVDEGVYTQAVDGVTMEAVKFTSTLTARNGSWTAESRNFQNSYTSPIVVGQVMSANDADWSVFWSMGSNQSTPVTASSLNVGKHVGEDPNTTRANETIGYIVIESGNGTVNGVAYEAGLGADSIQGPANSATPYNYTLSGTLNSASAAAISVSGMDGGDGGWAVLAGSPSFTSTSLGLYVYEDLLGDSENTHTTEQAAYIIFE